MRVSVPHLTPHGQVGRPHSNVRFSLRQASDYNHRMARVYREEWPHFLASLWPATDDPRMGLPQEMVLQLANFWGWTQRGFTRIENSLFASREIIRKRTGNRSAEIGKSISAERFLIS